MPQNLAGQDVETVSSTWSLVPSGLTVGESFRLLFVSSTTRNARLTDVDTYNTFVQTAAASGHTDIQSYSTHFNVLGSTSDDDARDNTSTTHTMSDKGVPIYWLDGAKVADDYEDFYDGDWDSNATKDESGTAVAAGAQVFTGSEDDGTRAGARHIGRASGNNVRIGKPGTSGEELDSGEDEDKRDPLGFYGLSGVFRVVGITPEISMATVNGGTLALTYSADLDSDSVPATGDFSVTVGGTARTVSDVSISGDTVTLELAPAVVHGETVTVTYTPGTDPIQHADGTDAAALTNESVTNNTLPVLSTAQAVASEGDPLEFTVTLSPASNQIVSVVYNTTDRDFTATQGTDFTASTGTLTFSIGETTKKVTVATTADDLDEGSETVYLILRSATNAILWTRGAVGAAVGTILDDDDPVALEVSTDWGLAPPGLTEGDSFRLLFVSSTTRSASTYAIGVYDNHVRAAATAGHADIQAHSAHFRVLGSVFAVDARDHTATTFTTSDTGFPIYWLDGDKVADDYTNFYDGDWDSNTPRDESGTAVAAGTNVLTGSEGDGTKAGSAHIGAPAGYDVRVGKPDTLGKELDGGEDEEYTDVLAFYGLSGVFTLVAPTTPAVSMATVDGVTLTLTYHLELDSDSVPATGDFSVTVGDATRTALDVSISQYTVTLELDTAVIYGEAVTVTYTPGTAPIQNVDGTDAEALTNHSVTNNTLPVLSAEQAAASEGDALEFTVTLSPASSETVTVEYETADGTATEGTDFTASTGTLTFSVGDTEKTVTVSTTPDELDEGSETLPLVLSEATNATLSNGRPNLSVAGTILDDEDPVAMEVSTSWSLAPSGVTAGSSFRLLFVSSTTRNAGAEAIGPYDTHVRAAAANTGHTGIQAYSANFRILGSTAVVDARDHTGTTYTATAMGVPIYWLDGNKVADDYSDFYDGDWDSNAPRDESGTAVTAGVKVFTGSADDGTSAGTRHLGGTTENNVQIGKPGTSGEELDSGADEPKTEALATYGLSGIFTLVQAITPEISMATVDGITLTLMYSVDLDSNSVPATGDFSVTVGDALPTVSNVSISGDTVTLELTSAVVYGETVTVTYTPGADPIQHADGTDAASLTNHSVTNNTLPVLTVDQAAASEGDALEFTVTLSPTSSQTVTVEYATASGTATQGTDFTESMGTLTFAPGDTEKTVTVQTTQDALSDRNETFLLTLSSATNATLQGGGSTSEATGTILDDDGPAGEDVALSWGLTPTGLAVGDTFRLLFVSSTARNARLADIATYNTFVQAAAASGHPDIQSYGTYFKALGSTASVDARDNTATNVTGTFTNVPIYWLDGDKVADDYSDFYDGDWDSNTARNESGTAVAAGAQVFTGSDGEGASVGAQHLGRATGNNIRVGKPGTSGEELDSGSDENKTNPLAFYGLSGIFRVVRNPDSKNRVTLSVAPDVVREDAGATDVTVTLTLQYPELAETEFELQLRDGTAESPQDFSAEPRTLEVTVLPGESTGTASFTVIPVHEQGRDSECGETVVVDGDPADGSNSAFRIVPAILTLTDPGIDETRCLPPHARPPITLVPDGPPTPPRTPDTEEPVPPLGPLSTTEAKVAIWTDQTGYVLGHQIRLYRSLDPRGDDNEYTFFYYLEHAGSGKRFYVAPGIGSTELENTVVDQFGMSEGLFLAGPIDRTDRELIWAGTSRMAGSWQFVTEIRSSDAKRKVKTVHAKFAVSRESPVVIASDGLSKIVSGNETWSSGKIYKLRQPVRVSSGASLTIEAGTLIQGLGPSAGIVVERGARIEVNGTRQAPVVMTCDAPVGHREPGCWGGLLIQGSAPTSSPGRTLVGALADDGNAFGGEDPGDSSGTLRFLRVEFAGGVPDGGNPRAAVALQGVGSGTVIEYLQAHESLGDGIAVRGGMASCNYCVSSGAQDDGFEISEGWLGTVQYLFVQQALSGDRGIEAWGPVTDSHESQRPALYNLTMVGGTALSPSASSGDGIHLHSGAAAIIRNLVLTGYGGLALGADADAGALFLEGRSTLQDAILHDNGGRYGRAQIAEALSPYVEFLDKDPQLLNARYEANPDPRPKSGSAALLADATAVPTSTSGLDPDPRILGAFSATNWLEEWTFFGPEADYLVPDQDQ